jgi:hypothetical protein
MKYPMPCGCVIDRKHDRYVKQCEKHQAEYDACHAASVAERAAARAQAQTQSPEA